MSGRNGMVDASTRAERVEIHQLPLRRSHGQGRPGELPEPSAGVALEPHGRGTSAACTGGHSTPGGGLSTFADALLTELSGVKPSGRLSHPAPAGSAENIDCCAPALRTWRSWPAKRRRTHSPVRTPRMALAALYGTPSDVRGPGVIRDTGISHRSAGSRFSGAPVAPDFVVVARQVIGSLGLDIEHDFRPVS